MKQFSPAAAVSQPPFASGSRVDLIDTKFRHVSHWHDDDGCVLWWHVPVQEPPEVGYGPGAGEKNADGTETTCARLIREGWFTYWTRIPVILVNVGVQGELDGTPPQAE